MNFSSIEELREWLKERAELSQLLYYLNSCVKKEAAYLYQEDRKAHGADADKQACRKDAELHYLNEINEHLMLVEISIESSDILFYRRKPHTLAIAKGMREYDNAVSTDEGRQPITQPQITQVPRSGSGIDGGQSKPY